MLKKILAFTCLAFSIAANSATLVLNEGQLMGATGVNVGGTFYDVSFLDGSCNSLYDGCSNFAFNDHLSAAVASQALLDQVFVGIYDDEPGLTNGIDERNLIAIVATIYSRCTLVQCTTRFGQGRAAYNTSALIGASDYVGGWIFEHETDSADSDRMTHAVWVPSPIPIPAAAWLFGSALLGLGAVKRRKT